MRIRVVTLGVALVLAGSGCVKTSRDVAVPSAPDDRGLVAHWTFDEGRGSVAKDVTGNGHDARLKGAQTLPEGHGRALLLEAKEAYADAGVAPGFQTAAGGAFSLWFRPRKLQGGLVNWSKGSGWTDIRLTLAFNTFYGGNEFLVSVSDGRSFEKIPVPAPPLDQWTHMAVSFAGPNLTVFVNGVPAVSRSVNCVPDRTGIPLWIGRCEGLGEAWVEIQDEDGQTIPGYRLEECDPVDLNHVRIAVTWQNNSDVGALQGRPVRLRFRMRLSKLYAFQFVTR